MHWDACRQYPTPPAGNMLFCINYKAYKEHDMKKDHAPTLSAILTGGMPGATIDRIIPTGKEGQYKAHGKMPTHEALIMWLHTFARQVPSGEGKEFIMSMADYLRTHLTSLTIKPTGEPGGYECTYNIQPGERGGSGEDIPKIKEKIIEILNTPVIEVWIRGIFGEVAYSDLIKREKALKRKEARLAKATRPSNGKSTVRVSSEYLRNDLAPIPLIQGDLFSAYGEEMSGEITKNDDWKGELKNMDGRRIPLTADEDRMILVLLEILQNKSQTETPEAEDYYTGNQVEAPKKFNNGEIKLALPKFSCTLYEIAKAFYQGSTDISGKQYENINKMLDHIAYDKETYCKVTIKIDEKREYHTFEHLIKKGTIKDRNAGGKGETIITLHSVFIAGIKDHYVEMPCMADIQKAIGSPVVKETCLNLIKELSSQKSWQNKHYKTDPSKKIKLYDIDKKELFRKIAPHYMPPNRSDPGRIKKQFIEGIEACKKLNLIEKMEEIKGGKNGILCRFHLTPKAKSTPG